MTTTRYLLGIALALALLIGMRAPLLRCEPFVAGTPQFFDERDYVRGANDMLAGSNANDLAQSWMRAPGTAWLLSSLARWRGGPAELVACDFQRVQVGLWVILLLLVANIAALLFDRRAALVAAWLVALMPIGLAVTVMVHADTLFALPFALTFWALLRYARARRLGWLALAAAGAGAAALVRSPILPLLPLLALWVAAETWLHLQRRSTGALPASSVPGQAQAELDERPKTKESAHLVLRLWSFVRYRALPELRATPAHTWLRVAIACALFLGLTALILTPWTVRNYRLYGGFIPSDTTGAINLFDNNAPISHVNHRAIRESSDNPAERQRYAMQQFWAIVASEPARFASKFAYTAWLAWSPEAFHRTLNFYVVVLERPLVGSLLTQLTVLVWPTLPLALLGMLLAPRDRPGAQGFRLTMLASAALYTLMIGLTHFEERYRIPYLLLWLPFAAWCLAHPRQLVASIRSRKPAAGLADNRTTTADHSRVAGRRPSVVNTVALLLILLASASYLGLLWPAQWQNAQALGLYARGLLRESWGDGAGALADQQAAAALQPRLTEAQVAGARLLAQQGDPAGAEAALRAALETARTTRLRPPPDVTVALQLLLRAQGREQESRALDFELSQPGRQQAEALAWNQGLPPGASLQLGSGDFGNVRGFYTTPVDADSRWSGPRALVRLAGTGEYACLRMSAARPAHVPAPEVRLSARRAGGSWAALGTLLPPRNGWGWFCAPTPAGDGAIELAIESAVYNPLLFGERDARDLGVALQAAELRAGPLAIDAASGLLLDRPAAAQAAPAFQLLGLEGTPRGRPGTTVPLALWWRGDQPPAGVFTFLHLRDAAGQTLAAYNAPLAGDRRPEPWVATEPLLDQVGIPLPADLPPGTYQLVGGAFNPADGAQLAQADLGEIVVEAR